LHVHVQQFGCGGRGGRKFMPLVPQLGLFLPDVLHLGYVARFFIYIHLRSYEQNAYTLPSAYYAEEHGWFAMVGSAAFLALFFQR